MEPQLTVIAIARHFGLSPKQLSRDFGRLVGTSPSAYLPEIRFHDLRHTFTTLALQNGVDVKTVSGMLGHFSAGFTLDTYAHVTTAAQKKAAETMGAVLAG